MIKELKNRVLALKTKLGKLKISRNDVPDDYFDIYIEYSKIVKEFNKIIHKVESDEDKIDSMLLYSYIEDIYYEGKSSFLEFQDEFKEELQDEFSEIKPTIGEFVKETGILDDKNEFIKLKKDFFKSNNPPIEEEEEYEENMNEEDLPQEGEIYRCIKERKVKRRNGGGSYVKFEEGDFYQVLKVYKGKSGKYHIILFNKRDKNKKENNSYLYNFDKHFDLDKVYDENEVIEIMKEEHEKIDNALPPAGFVSNLKKRYN